MLRDWISPRDIIKSAITALILAGLTWLATWLFDINWGRVSLPLWAPFAAIVLTALVSSAIAHRLAAPTYRPLVLRLLRDRQLRRIYARHQIDVLETLRALVEGDLGNITMEHFIERGVLSPAREWLRQAPNEDVRLSILVPDPANPLDFMMWCQEGHRVQSQAAFRIPIATSFGGIAYRDREMIWSNNLPEDPRFRPHPNADPARAYMSLVSVPVIVDGEVYGVLNVLSTVRNAFPDADLLYIRELGAMLTLTLCMPGWEPAGTGVGAPPQLPPATS